MKSYTFYATEGVGHVVTIDVDSYTVGSTAKLYAPGELVGVATYLNGRVTISLSPGHTTILTTTAYHVDVIDPDTTVTRAIEGTIVIEEDTTGLELPPSPDRVPQIDPDKMVYFGAADANIVSIGGTTTLHDTTDFAIGTECLKTVTPASGSVPCGFAVFSGTTLPDMTGNDIILWIKIQGMANTIDFKFWIGTSGLSNAYIWSLNEASTGFPYVRDGDWYKITLPLGTATVSGSTPDLTALNSWQLKVYDNGSAPITLKLGGIGYVKRQTKYPNGVVTIRFDDLFKSQYTKAAPYMAKYGFSATSYVICETLFNNAVYPTYATLDEAHKLEDMYGWEHASHSYLVSVHNQTSNAGGNGVKGYTAYSKLAQQRDMILCREFLEAEGFKMPNHFAWPQGAWDKDALEAAQEIFSTAITVTTANHETIPVADPMRIRCYSPPSTVTGAQLKAEVDKAIAGKEWLVILFHNIADTVVNDFDTSTTAFTQLIDYLAAEEVDVRLMSEVLDVGN